MSNQNENSYCGADEDLKGISQDDIKRKAAFKRERAEADYINRYDDGFEDGIEQGIEQGIIASHNEGLEIDLIARIFNTDIDKVRKIIDSNKE